jgi:hypothetical protein
VVGGGGGGGGGWLAADSQYRKAGVVTKLVPVSAAHKQAIR